MCSKKDNFNFESIAQHIEIKYLSMTNLFPPKNIFTGAIYALTNVLRSKKSDCS